MTSEYIKKNLLLDSESFHEIDKKIEGKCMIDDNEIDISLPKTINRVNVLNAIQNNNITDAMAERIITAIQKKLSNEEKDNKDDVHWLRARVDEETYQRIMYWSQKRDCSVNEYLNMAIDHMIRWENQDYDLPTLEQQRLQQLINAINALTSDVRCLENITTEGFKSLIGLTRGDNYLLDEDGEM